MLICALVLSGCSKEPGENSNGNKSVTDQGSKGNKGGEGSGSGNGDQDEGDGQNDESRYVEFKEDTVFAVNGELISEGEWNLYAVPELEKAGRLYGDDIWDYKVDADGKLFSEVFKDGIIRQIASVKIVAGQAENLGIRLTDDDQVEISIQTADYLDKLSAEQKKEYGITEELVRKVYSDNILAMKVYEHLTLNVDTSTDEEQVRHMELQYVVVSKSYEDSEGNVQLYSDSELEGIRQRLKSFVKQAGDNGFGQDGEGNTSTGSAGNGTAGESDGYVKLSDLESEEFTVTDIVAGLEDLKGKFPEELAGVAFWLREHEISDILETEEAFFVFDCVKLTDKEATDAARIEVIEQREKDVFNAGYAEWEKAAVLQLQR